MPYIVTTTDQRGRTETCINLLGFAADLAKQFSTTVIPVGEYPNERCGLTLGEDHLILTAKHRDGRVVASTRAPEIQWGDRNTYDKNHRTPDASVNPDGRSIEAIAKDIKRRVIEPSREPLRLQREYAAKLKAERANVKATTDMLVREMPDLQVRIHDDKRSAGLYLNKGHAYVDATLRYDGSIEIRHFSTVKLDTFKQLVALLQNGGK